MPALSLVTTTVQAVTLKPLVAKKLTVALETYQTLRTEIKALQAALALEQERIEAIRTSVGAPSFEFKGAKITRVEGVSSKLDQKKLIALGVTTAQIEKATVYTPKKAYTKITLPGEKDYAEQH